MLSNWIYILHLRICATFFCSPLCSDLQLYLMVFAWVIALSMKELKLHSEVIHFLTIMLFSRVGRGKAPWWTSLEPEVKGTTKMNVSDFHESKGAERKGAKAALFLGLIVPQVGFVWGKVITIYLQIKWTHLRLHALTWFLPENSRLNHYLLMFDGRQKAFLLKKKKGGLENLFCLGDKWVTRLSVGRWENREVEFLLQLLLVQHRAGLWAHFISCGRYWLRDKHYHLCAQVPAGWHRRARNRIGNWAQDFLIFLEEPSSPPCIGSIAP